KRPGFMAGAFFMACAVSPESPRHVDYRTVKPGQMEHLQPDERFVNGADFTFGRSVLYQRRGRKLESAD
ncbi:hypothetical protein, partial [Thalassospira marina]|uniref:hypothetical protein n=1 Tax=Thalassospira marina TaxID=2048283 RepID=UPI001C2BE549